MLQHNHVGIRLLPEDGEVGTAVQFAIDAEIVLQGIDSVSISSSIWIFMRGPLVSN